MNIVNLLEFESAARAHLEPSAFDYFVSGADDEVTLAENRAAFSRLKLHYRVLTGIKTRSLETEILGQKLALPVIVSPMAFQRLADADGEVAMARAVADAGSLMTMSTMATSSMEEIQQKSPATKLWYQIYLFNDRDTNLAMIERAVRAGAKALVLTVDTPMLGKRERDVRNRFQPPTHLGFGNLMEGLDAVPEDTAGSGLAAHAKAHFKLDIGWEDLAWLCSVSSLPIIIKGVCHHADAKVALEHGVAGIWVSNHGGRQLDTSPATIEVLPRIADAVAGAVPLILDGGVRRGTDVIKALALGADCVAVGRPMMWALALGGQAGVAHAFELLRAEIDAALCLSGYADVRKLPRALLTGE
jgi:4-hydroxymandelate oxidase